MVFYYTLFIYEEIKIINSNLNTNSFTNFINQFIYNTNEYLLSYGIDSQIKSDDIISLLPITSFTTLFDSIFSILGNMFLASFSILFMTFFMLRDSSIIKEKIHNILSNYLTNVDEKMDSIVFYLKDTFLDLDYNYLFYLVVMQLD